MENAPEVPKCFGMFPPKYATYLISLFGLAAGGCGLAGIVLYSLVEDSIVAHFMHNAEVDETVKKVALLTIGLSSIFVFVANFLIFIGVAFKSTASLTTGAWILFVMCFLVIIAAIALPVSCFFLPMTCVIKQISQLLLVFGYLGITVFLCIWLYFMVVVFNRLNEM